MVALIADFEGHLTGQFLLHDETPLLHHGIAEVLRNRAELQGRDRLGGKDRQRIACGDAADPVSVRKERIRVEPIDTGRPIQLRGLVERRRLASVGITALLLLASVEDAERGAYHCLRANVPGDANSRADIVLVPRDQVLIHYST